MCWLIQYSVSHAGKAGAGAGAGSGAGAKGGIALLMFLLKVQLAQSHIKVNFIFNFAICTGHINTPT